MNSEKQAAADRFINWVHSPESGIECSDVELRYCSANSGFGVFARTNIRWNGCLVKVPRRLVITANLILGIPDYEVFLENGLPQLRIFDLLVLFFCVERLYMEENYNNVDPTSPLGRFLARRAKWDTATANLDKGDTDVKISDSTWMTANRSASWFRAYFKLLPREFGTGVERCYENGAINKSLVDEIASSLPAHARTIFSNQIVEYENVVKKLTAIFEDTVDPKLFCWAWHIVNTRCLWIDETQMKLLSDSESRRSDNMSEKSRKFSNYSGKILEDNEDKRCSIAIIPLVDMFNHSVDAQCLASYDRISASYSVYASNRAIAEGSQLYFCYGPHDNARLWLEYGFKLGVGNIYNRVTISTDLFIELARKSGLAVGGLDSHHEQVIRESNLCCTLYASDEEPSYGLRKCCRIALLRRSQLYDWRRIIYEETPKSPSSEDIVTTESTESQTVEECTTKMVSIKVTDENADELSQNMIVKVLSLLRDNLARRAEKVMRDEFRTFWTDQMEIVDYILARKSEWIRS